MFLVDDILLAPARGLVWIFREIENAADQDLENEAEAISARLTELYLMLEAGNISEQEFDARERELLDRLDVIQAADELPGAEGDDDNEEESYEYVLEDPSEEAEGP